MSTSCNSAPPPPRPSSEAEPRPFPYAELPEGSLRAQPAPWGAQGKDAALAANQEAAARQAGRQEGEAQARAAFEARLGEIRESVRSALAEFARQRAAYYQQVEGEVVRLALSIARKILRREAQIDPLLLAGMVRVVLEKLERGTRVAVRVHPQQVSECRAYFAQHMEPQAVPEVLEDAALPLDHCLLQTELGTTELGPEIELKEIERGLFDLLERRPASRV